MFVRCSTIHTTRDEAFGSPKIGANAFRSLRYTPQQLMKETRRVPRLGRAAPAFLLHGSGQEV